MPLLSGDTDGKGSAVDSAIGAVPGVIGDRKLLSVGVDLKLK